MLAPDRTLKNATLLIEAARDMDVPALPRELYPLGPGWNMPKIAAVAAGCPIFEKVHFSCMEDQIFAKAPTALNRVHIVLAGMEANVCVVQTAASLLEAGYEAFVVSEATATHAAESEGACLQRLGADGVGIVTTGMIYSSGLAQPTRHSSRNCCPR